MNKCAFPCPLCRRTVQLSRGLFPGSGPQTPLCPQRLGSERRVSPVRGVHRTSQLAEPPDSCSIMATDDSRRRQDADAFTYPSPPAANGYESHPEPAPLTSDPRIFSFTQCSLQLPKGCGRRSHSISILGKLASWFETCPASSSCSPWPYTNLEKGYDLVTGEQAPERIFR